MKRFHVNVSVRDLAESVRFYSALFDVEPTVREIDYAKWMLDDPFINFAISARGYAPGLNHLGFQAGSAEELTTMRDQLARADDSLVEQIAEPCCYARSDKYWVTDPVGIAWETFHTLDSIPIYGDDTVVAPKDPACCAPKKATSPCCDAKSAESTDESCCAV
jgi:catechol 2,3-dioxygenase-like lactoylglutathione lyase family enzyme